MKLNMFFETKNEEREFEITGWEERKLRGGEGPDTEDRAFYDQVQAKDKEQAMEKAKKMYPKAHGLRVAEVKKK